MLFDNMTFYPSGAGWQVGQQVSVLCVGGGGGGAGGVYTAGGQAGWGGKSVNNGNNSTALAGGGGGAGYGAGGGGGASNGGGGGSGYITRTTFVVQNLNPIAVTIGKRGTGGAANNGAGGNGGITSFGTILSANGGGGGRGYRNVGIGQVNGTNPSYAGSTYAGGGGGGAGYIPFVERVQNKLFNSFNTSARNISLGLTGLVGGFRWVNSVLYPIGLGGEGGYWVSNSTVGSVYFDGAPGKCFPSCDSAGLGVIILEW